MIQLRLELLRTGLPITPGITTVTATGCEPLSPRLSVTVNVTVALPERLTGVAFKVQDWLGFWKAVKFPLGRSAWLEDDSTVTVKEAAGGTLLRTLRLK